MIVYYRILNKTDNDSCDFRFLLKRLRPGEASGERCDVSCAFYILIIKIDELLKD